MCACGLSVRASARGRGTGETEVAIRVGDGAPAGKGGHPKSRGSPDPGHGSTFGPCGRPSLPPLRGPAEGGFAPPPIHIPRELRVSPTNTDFSHRNRMARSNHFWKRLNLFFPAGAGAMKRSRALRNVCHGQAEGRPAWGHQEEADGRSGSSGLPLNPSDPPTNIPSHEVLLLPRTQPLPARRPSPERGSHAGINPSPFQKGNVSAELFQGIWNRTRSPPLTPREGASFLLPTLPRENSFSSLFPTAVPNETLCTKPPTRRASGDL